MCNTSQYCGLLPGISSAPPFCGCSSLNTREADRKHNRRKKLLVICERKQKQWWKKKNKHKNHLKKCTVIKYQFILLNPNNACQQTDDLNHQTQQLAGGSSVTVFGKIVPPLTFFITFATAWSAAFYFPFISYGNRFNDLFQSGNVND